MRRLLTTLIIILASLGGAFAQPYTYTLQFEADTGTRQDGPGAYRVTIGQELRGRCALRNRASGQEYSLEQIAALFPRSRLSLRKIRGVPGRAHGGGWGPSVVTLHEPGLSIWRCEFSGARAPDPVEIRDTVIVGEERQTTANRVAAYFARTDSEDPVRRFSINEQIRLRMKQFTDDLRTGYEEPAFRDLSWSTRSKPCDQPPALLPWDVLDRSSQPVRQSDDTLTLSLMFKKPGRYHACAKFADGRGRFIEKPLSITIETDGKPPRLEALSVTQEQFGFMDINKSRSEQHDRYEARLVVYDQDVENVRVRINNTQTSVDARLVNRVDDRGVFAADLPFAPGLQIVEAVAVDRGGNKASRMTSFFAGQEMLSAIPSGQSKRVKSGAHLFVSDALIDNRGTNVPSSIQQALNNLTRADWQRIIPPQTIRKDINLADAAGLNVAGLGNQFLDVRGVMNVQNVSVQFSKQRNERRARLTLDMNAEVEAKCYVLAWGNARVYRDCPNIIVPNNTVTVEVETSVTVNASFASIVSPSSERFLAFTFADNDVTGSVSVANDARFIDGMINDEVEKEVGKIITARGLKTEILGCDEDDGRITTCNPKEPLSSFVQGRKRWFGLKLTDNQAFETMVSLPMVLGSDPAQAMFRAIRPEVALESPWLRSSVVGGLIQEGEPFVSEHTYLRVSDARQALPRVPLRGVLNDAQASAAVGRADGALIVHLDTLNGWLAGWYAMGAIAADMTAPEFLDAIAPTPEQKRSSPFAALAHFPRGRVRIKPGRAPRVAPRGDLDGDIALELDSISVKIDLRPRPAGHNGVWNGSYIKLRFAAMAALDVAVENGAASLSLKQHRRCNLSTNYIPLKTCRLWMKVDVEEREGFTAYELMPTLENEQNQARLLNDWKRLRTVLNTAPLLNENGQNPVESSGLMISSLLKLLFASKAEDIFPLTYDFPPFKLIERTGLPLRDEDEVVLDGLNLLPAWNGSAGSEGWVGLTGGLLTPAQSTALREADGDQ